METGTQKSLAVAELNPIVTDIAAFAGTLEGMEVIDEESQGSVGDLVKMMNHRRKKLEDKRTSLVAPLNKVVKDINEMFKAPRDRIDEILKLARGKLNKFARAQQAIADEAKRLEREEAERERREAQELAEKLRQKTEGEGEMVAIALETQAEANVVVAKKPARVPVSRGRESSVSVKKTWKCEVTNLVDMCLAIGEGRLPVTLVEPQMQALNDLARNIGEAREVSGIRIYEDITTAVR